MRGRVMVLLWIAATAAATGVAWLGVRSVVDEVAAPLPAPQLATDAPQATPERPTATATPMPQAPTTRTFAMTGGTATVRFSPDEVEVVSAVPASGYETDVDAEAGRTRVEFESDDDRSRLDAWWDGRPRHRIQEEDRGDGDDDD